MPAAYPVAGPGDIIGTSGAGALSEDLQEAALTALSIDRSHCRAHAECFSWSRCTGQFAANLVPLKG